MILPLQIRAWWTQKAGHEVSEYEDAYHIGETTDGSPLRLAVADGATGATFSALWAELLATDYTKGFLTPDSLSKRVPLLARAWIRRVEAEPLPWHAQAKVSRDGSHAALLGLTIDSQTGTYSALSVGDCALVHLRPTEEKDTYAVALAFPYTRWTDFNGSPTLIGTQAAAQANLAAHIHTVQGKIGAGDRLYLMSDALAAWFLREIEKERAPWRWLAALYTSNADVTLTNMVRELRDTQRLKNDDVTVVSVHVA